MPKTAYQEWQEQQRKKYGGFNTKAEFDAELRRRARLEEQERLKVQQEEQRRREYYERQKRANNPSPSPIKKKKGLLATIFWLLLGKKSFDELRDE